nr:unnamed protein product [Spirometra erinaceieuropaei]
MPDLSSSFPLTILLVLCLCYFPVIHAIIPVECVGNVTKPSAICCPRNPENYQVCGGPHRGYCTKIVAPVQYVPVPFQMDDRCRGNFFGTSCQDCWFGWTGPNCDIPVRKVRKDIRDLTPKERRIFIDVFARSSYWPSGYALVDETDNFHSDPLNDPKFVKASIQYYVTYAHRYGSRTTLYKTDEDCNTYGMLDFIHDGPGFPTWHRYYVRGERDSTKCTSFSMALEGFCGPTDSAGPDLWLHNKVHNMVDGSMCCVGTAANDPLFLLHHTMVDKLFTIMTMVAVTGGTIKVRVTWYQKYDPELSEFPQQAVRPGHCRDCFMPGFFPLARNADMFTDTRNLGYVYDDSVFGARAQNGRAPIAF